MDLLFVDVPQFWSYLQTSFTRSELFVPICRDRLQEIARHHRSTFLPRSGEQTWGREELILSRRFMTIAGPASAAGRTMTQAVNLRSLPALPQRVRETS